MHARMAVNYARKEADVLNHVIRPEEQKKEGGKNSGKSFLVMRTMSKCQ